VCTFNQVSWHTMGARISSLLLSFDRNIGNHEYFQCDRELLIFYLSEPVFYCVGVFSPQNFQEQCLPKPKECLVSLIPFMHAL
jgi:hypothetical protein